MNELEIFAEPLAAAVYQWASFAILVLYAAIAVRVIERTSDRLPARVVRQT